MKSKKLAKPSHHMTSDEELALKEEERLRQNEKRRAKRLAKHFAELGLDENGDPTDNFSLLKYPVSEWKFELPGFHEAVAVNGSDEIIFTNSLPRGISCMQVKSRPPRYGGAQRLAFFQLPRDVQQPGMGPIFVSFVFNWIGGRLCSALRCCHPRCGQFSIQWAEELPLDAKTLLDEHGGGLNHGSVVIRQ